jgi:hypothetical protein
LPDGSETAYWEGAGGFDPLVFALEIADIDWASAPGCGVALDLNIRISEQSELTGLLRMLSDFGWVSDAGAWRISQSIITWNGFGAAGLVEQLEEWQVRYGRRPMHHTEQVIYADAFDGGFYTVFADVSAHEIRQVTNCQVSFQLSGIPLDLGPLQSLVSAFRIDGSPYFRTRMAASIRRRSITKPHESVEPSALVVRSDVSTDDSVSGEWVVGIILDDSAKSTDFGADIGMSEHSAEQWLCSLRSWHRVAQATRYQVIAVESAQSSDVKVLKVLADWVYEGEAAE